MNNYRLVFDLGNQWSKDSKVAPFFAVPSWWRRFIFKVLSAREYTIYSYLCSIFDKHAIAYPAVEQIAADLGISSRVIVSRALDRLVKYGFILRGPRRIRGRLLSARPVYQRPLAAFTLLRLLELKLINESLIPLSDNESDGSHDSSEGAVALGLRNILGRDLYQAYRIASVDARRAVLIAALKERITSAVARSREIDTRIPEKLPASVSALIATDQNIPF